MPKGGLRIVIRATCSTPSCTTINHVAVDDFTVAAQKLTERGWKYLGGEFGWVCKECAPGAQTTPEKPPDLELDPDAEIIKELESLHSGQLQRRLRLASEDFKIAELAKDHKGKKEAALLMAQISHVMSKKADSTLKRLNLAVK